MLRDLARSLLLSMIGVTLLACKSSAPPKTVSEDASGSANHQAVQTKTFGDTDEASIRAILAAQADAWNRGDLEAFMAPYEKSEDLVFTAGGKIQRGFTQTYDGYKKKYGEGKDSDMGQLAFEIDDVRGLGENAAIVLGHWKLTETPQAAGGVFSLAFVRSDGGWRIVHDHTSVSDKPEKE